jgi:hypothetical protein
VTATTCDRGKLSIGSEHDHTTKVLGVTLFRADLEANFFFFGDGDLD